MKYFFTLILCIFFPLSILSQDVAILYPTNDTQIFPGQEIEIIWNNPENEIVDLFYRFDNEDWTLIEENLSQNSYKWTIPNNNAGQISFRVSYSVMPVPQLYWHAAGSHEDYVYSGAFTPSGNYFLTASIDNMVRLWDVNDKNLANQVDVSRIGSLQYAVPYDDNLVFGAVSNYLVQIDFSGGIIINNVIDVGTEIRSVDCTPAYGGLVAATSKDGFVYLFDLNLNYVKKFQSNSAENLYSVRFSRDGSRLCLTEYNGMIDCYMVESEDLIFSKNAHGEGTINAVIWSVDISPDNSKIASCGTDTKVKLWDYVSDNPLATFESHTRHVRSLRISPIDDLMVSGSLDGTLRFYNTQNLYEYSKIKIDYGADILTVDFSHDGNFVSAAGRANDFKIWRVYRPATYQSQVDSKIFREFSIYIPDIQVSLNEEFKIPVLTDNDFKEGDLPESSFNLEILVEMPILIVDILDYHTNVSGREFDTLSLNVVFDLSQDTLALLDAFSLLGPYYSGYMRILEIKSENGFVINTEDGLLTIIEECPSAFSRHIQVGEILPGITMYPNPANSVANILADIVEDGDYTITITDINGAIRKEIKNYFKYGSHTITLETKDIVNGTYFVNLIGKNIFQSIPFIVEH
ncbi:MAG: T9SS type A sorting domain-containing protein [Candidatus Kapabacteria bacterium]|nr:T9SS type A sorting domain-containing protein [Ignavibacteriota bacterium]MCW5885273.1 T9SS type A sorting domain-containing protein [Candidatus Kapabacteria bacterium]